MPFFIYLFSCCRLEMTWFAFLINWLSNSMTGLFSFSYGDRSLLVSTTACRACSSTFFVSMGANFLATDLVKGLLSFITSTFWGVKSSILAFLLACPLPEASIVSLSCFTLFSNDLLPFSFLFDLLEIVWGIFSLEEGGSFLILGVLKYSKAIHVDYKKDSQSVFVFLSSSSTKILMREKLNMLFSIC